MAKSNEVRAKHATEIRGLEDLNHHWIEMSRDEMRERGIIVPNKVNRIFQCVQTGAIELMLSLGNHTKSDKCSLSAPLICWTHDQHVAGRETMLRCLDPKTYNVVKRWHTEPIYEETGLVLPSIGTNGNNDYYLLHIATGHVLGEPLGFR